MRTKKISYARGPESISLQVRNWGWIFGLKLLFHYIKLQNYKSNPGNTKNAPELELDATWNILLMKSIDFQGSNNRSGILLLQMCYILGEQKLIENATDYNRMRLTIVKVRYSNATFWGIFKHCGVVSSISRC